MWVAFVIQKLLTFFQQKISMYLLYFKVEIFTSLLLSYEQLGPEHWMGSPWTSPIGAHKIDGLAGAIEAELLMTLHMIEAH